MEEVNKNIEVDNTDKKLHISDVSSSKNYSWECGNFTGKVKAKNIKDALIKSVKDFYDVRDYPSKNSIRLDIRVVEE
jgi:hypothetical protein